MKIGQSANITRTYYLEDMLEYGSLSGEASVTTQVPEPLIDALFSFLLGVKLPGRGTLYLQQETHYIIPATLGKPLTARVEIVQLRPEKHLAELITTCHDHKQRLIATGKALVYTADVKT